MASFEKITTFKVPDGTTSLFGFDAPSLKNMKFITKPKGVILFIHGFNSSAQIWGDETTGFVSEAIKQEYLPFVIDFSDSFNGSIVNLADHDLYNCFTYINESLPPLTKQKNLKMHFVAHSMGGIILRYFLDLNHKHANHDPVDFNKLNLKSGALLGVPNHGISKANSDNFVSKMDKIILDFNSLVGDKFSLKLANKAFYQLLSGNSVIESLLKDLASNMWPQLYWMNFIALRDIVVDRSSSFFEPEEISFLKNHFYQADFDATHMRNPFHAFTDALHEKLPLSDSNLFSRIEKKTPDFLGFLTKNPIYGNKDLIKEYFSHIGKL